MDVYMPGYGKDSLHKFQHPTPTIPHHSPNKWVLPNYGSTAPQLEHPTDDYPSINPEKANNVQQVVGTFLYYSRAVDLATLVTLNSTTSEQAKTIQ